MKKREDYIGKVVVNIYKIQRFISAGAYSWVYVAKHVRAERYVAVKIFHCLPYKNVEELIDREATNMVRSEGHKNIIRFLECSRPGDPDPFIVIELKDGNLRTYPPSNLFAILAVVKKIASALQYAHEKGIIHLDVKPENILWDRATSNAFLSDFGISRKINVLTGRAEPNSTTGSYHYMSPECADGNPCAASDQYSLAITLYELLCKARPFQGNTASELERQHREVVPPSIYKHRESLPQGRDDVLQRIDAVLQRALKKSPKLRYKDVEAFSEALDDAVSGLSYPAVTSTNTVATISSSDNIATRKSRRAAILRFALLGAAVFTSLGMEEYIVSIQPKTNSLISRMPTKSAPLSLKPTASVSTSSHIPALGFGSLINTYTGHTEAVTIAIPSPDKQFVASGTISGEVDIWKISNNALLKYPHKQKNAIHDIAWLPDNQSIVSTSDTHILAWDAFTGRVLPKWPLYRNEEGYDLNTRWSPEPQRKHVALYVGSKVIIFDNPLDSNGWNNRDITYTQHTDTVSSIAWSPNGSLLASASYDTTVQAWNVETGQRILKYLSHQCPVVAVAWSPDGHYLASAGNDGVIHIYRALPNTLLVDMYYHSIHKEQSVSITALAWSLDSQFLASSGDDNRVRVWKLQTHQPLDYAGHKDAVNYISWLYHQQRQCIMSCSADKTVQIWRATQQL